MPDPRVTEVLSALKSKGVADEGVVLSTCNRVEYYLSTRLEGLEALSALRDHLSLEASDPAVRDGQFYGHGEPSSLEHLFRVASGLDSMILGETEILGQMKKAYELALQGKHTGARLNKAFQKAFNVAKQIRTETQIQRGSTSVAAVSVELSERIFSTLKGREVLVIGAGDTSEKSARALLSRGASQVLVTNRSPERAEALASELGGRAVPWADWETLCVGIDIIISSTSAPHFVLDKAKVSTLMRLRQNRPLLMVDIAVPRDIDPEVNQLEGVFLYNVDDLQAIADGYIKQRQAEILRCEEIIRSKVGDLMRSGPPPRPMAEA